MSGSSTSNHISTIRETTVKDLPGLKPASPEKHSQNVRRRKPRPKANPVNPLKSRLRSISRLLSHKSSTMPADQLLALQREEGSIRTELDSIESQARLSRRIAKYRKVRFFERRKAERRLKQAQKRLHQLQEGEHNADNDLQEQVYLCQIDLNYTIFFPLARRYVSLFVKGLNEEETVHRDNSIWLDVKRAMDENKLEELRDGRWTSHPEKEAPHEANMDHNSLHRITRAAPSSHSGTHVTTSYEEDKNQRSSTKLEVAGAQAESDDGSSEDDGLAFFEYG